MRLLENLRLRLNREVVKSVLPIADNTKLSTVCLFHGELLNFRGLRTWSLHARMSGSEVDFQVLKKLLRQSKPC